MIEFISSWTQGIIVAVIVASIIEMILPNGNSKKYIKVVIGIYILFNIITPIINKVSGISGTTLDVSKFLDLDTYVSKDDKNTINSNNIEKKNEENIKQIYISKLKSDIKNKLKDMDYIIKNIQIYLENDENYTIKNISLIVTKDNNNLNDENNDNKIKEIEEVNIVIGNDENETNGNTRVENDTSSITEKEKKEIKEYLNKTYNIKIQNINIS